MTRPRYDTNALPTAARIPALARPAWDLLRAGLASVAVPCTAEPGPWFSDDAASRAEAAQACTTCPLILACAGYADAAQEKFGTWAGIERSVRSGPRPR